MFVRLHKPPKQCAGAVHGTMTSRQRYYFDLSYRRYLKTKDGESISKAVRNMEPEIGSHESVRFIQSPTRESMCAPPGDLLDEHDFAGQEARWMAEYSRDTTMLGIFNSKPPYDDIHAYMGARLTSRSFENMIQDWHADKETEIFKQAKNDRYLGKFANLSLQYRTSANTLMRKARIDYKIPMMLLEAQRVKQTYEATFSGVPAYWASQIQFAKAHGYVESFNGKRFRFAPNAWQRDRTWSSGSTAINWPIQGIGGSQKSLAMKHLIPYLRGIAGEFAWDLHDGLFSFIPEDIAYEEALNIKEILSNLPYEQEWGYKPSIPFPVDASIGPNWGKLEEI